MNSKYIIDSSAWIEYLNGSFKGAKISQLNQKRNSCQKGKIWNC